MQNSLALQFVGIWLLLSAIIFCRGSVLFIMSLVVLFAGGLGMSDFLVFWHSFGLECLKYC